MFVRVFFHVIVIFIYIKKILLLSLFIFYCLIKIKPLIKSKWGYNLSYLCFFFNALVTPRLYLSFFILILVFILIDIF
jgi:hypothetical protein